MRQKKWLFLLAVFIAGCATFSHVKPWGERAPQEKVLSFYQMYNSQYADTLRLANTPGLTEAQKEGVRYKKELLKKVRPLLSAYDGIVIGGGIPPADLEVQIIGLIDKLAASGG